MVQLAVPQVEFIEDLHHLSDVFYTADDDQDVFSQSTFAVITDDFYVLYGESQARRQYVSATYINGNVERISDEHICPEAP